MGTANKKGFTLVELIVVIAVLAIIAAIAIPAVILAMNNASSASSASNASALDMACKDFYAGVTTGIINESSKGAVDQALPAATATVLQKKSGAKEATVKSAIQYAGLSSKFPDNNALSGYQYNSSDGTITYTESSIDNVSHKPLTLETTFAQLYQYN